MFATQTLNFVFLFCNGFFSNPAPRELAFAGKGERNHLSIRYKPGTFFYSSGYGSRNVFLNEAHFCKSKNKASFFVETCFDTICAVRFASWERSECFMAQRAASCLQRKRFILWFCFAMDFFKSCPTRTAFAGKGERNHLSIKQWLGTFFIFRVSFCGERRLPNTFCLSKQRHPLRSRAQIALQVVALLAIRPTLFPILGGV